MATDRKKPILHRVAGINRKGIKMKRIESLPKPLMGLMALLLAASVTGCGGGGGGGAGASPTAPGTGTGLNGAGRGPAPVNLKTAANFVILAEAAITSVPASPVTGNVGLSPAAGSFIGLTCAEVTGTIYAVDAAGPPCSIPDPARLTTAILDKGTAYTEAAGRAPDYTELGAGNIGGLNLGPATYKWSTPVIIPSNVTLTGGPNDVWIFQLAQGLAVSSGVQVILAGGALPQNVFWQTFAAADFGTTSKFSGVVLSQTSIALKTGASIKGRLLAGTAVTLDQSTVTQPTP
jgi:hypothetical protein